MCQSLYLLVLLPDHYDSFLVLQRCEHESHERKVLGRRSHHEGEKSKARSSKGKEPDVATEEAPSPQSRLKSVKDIYNIRLREDGCDYHAILVGNRPEQASDVALEVDLAPLTHGTRIWHDERASVCYLRGTQIPRLAVDLYTLLSEVLMDQATKAIVLGQLAEVRERLDDSEEQLRSSQTKIQQIEIELLKMTWVKDQFRVNLPREVVEDYKKSLNFEMSLVRMGRVLLQYNYQLALAWLRARHLKLEIEPNPFT
ncbi:hypothetical protein GW17_00049858 [Ensete ventricosum]|uniref:Uncharacterized protein n=1 Tax=Ensete ventricosum TaxID=4639 RepID=A0A444CQG3_ENSVE|nr:hypothetical protein GW17_00049858 [Ensete ventricosum]RZR72889.1 hypothetical protein BHM03_00018319 [Ensete ventricosum]